MGAIHLDYRSCPVLAIVIIAKNAMKANLSTYIRRADAFQLQSISPKIDEFLRVLIDVTYS